MGGRPPAARGQSRPGSGHGAKKIQIILFWRYYCAISSQVTEPAGLFQSPRRTPVSDISGTFDQAAKALPRARTRARYRARANAEIAWRRWATEHRVAAAALVGIVAVQPPTLLPFSLPPLAPP